MLQQMRVRIVSRPPSTSAKCGYALQKAALVVKGKASGKRESCVCGKKEREQDMERKNNVDLFMELYEGEWSGKVTSRELQNLSFKKHNKPHLLPITNDLMTLRTFLHDNILALTNEVCENPVKENGEKAGSFSVGQTDNFQQT